MNNDWKLLLIITQLFILLIIIHNFLKLYKFKDSLKNIIFKTLRLVKDSLKIIQYFKLL
jgi:hypothetical protein